MKISLLLALVCLLAVDLYAQQDPLYAQYFNNPLLINPAFAGSTERLFASLAYRTQWSGMEGAPTTFSFNSHLSLADNKAGVGIVVTHDRLGEFRNAQYGGAFSYRIKLSSTTFAFGMHLGFMQYASDLKGVKSVNNDPLFAPFSETKFNTGAGVMLKNYRYTFALSVPHLLANSIRQGDQAIQVYSQNYYAYGAYLFYINERVELRPSSLLRFTRGAPLSADVNLNLTFSSLYTAGLFTRNLNTYGLLLQLVMKNMRFSYMYELPGKSSALNFNTHELGLALSLDMLPSHDHTNTGF